MTDEYNWALFLSPLAGVIIGLIPSILATIYGPGKQEEAKNKSERDAHVWKMTDELRNDLLENISGFSSGADTTLEEIQEMRADFIEAYKKYWLYAPDEEIKALNSLLMSMRDKTPEDQSPTTQNFRQMVLAMRKSMIPETKLVANEVQVIKAR